MFEYVNCNLCGSNSYEIIYRSTIKEDDPLVPDDLVCSNLGHGRHHPIVRCKKCGLLYANPRDSHCLLEDFYKKARDKKYYYASEGRIKTFKNSLAHLETHKHNKGTILDIGCYTGLFIKVARSQGWNAVGLEPSFWASEIGKREYGLNILNGGIYELNGFAEKFDVITMWDVLEHVRDPYSALKICYEKLSDNGILALSTMRCEGMFYSFCRHLWPWFMRMHLYYFTVATVSELLSKAGFRVIALHPYTHYIDAGYFLYKMSVLSSIFSFFGRSGFLKHIIFPVQLGDFMEIYAVKK